jgi:LacI family transcriptional regulator
MAVSTVLNGARTSARISPETRVRILAAAKELNYRPNAAARALAARRMDTLGVAGVSGEGELNTYFLEIFNGVLEAALRHDQNTTVFALHNWEEDAITRLPRFCDGRIDGLIILAPRFSPEAVAALPEHTPCITVHSNVPIPGVINLESDEEHGAYEMVRYLIRRGHRRILHLSGDRGFVGSERRIRGYQRALTEAGLPLDPSLLVDSRFTLQSGRESMERWFAGNVGHPLPHAVFCGNDGIAAGVLEVLAARGIAVPGDVSVTGFDDALSARTTSPQLTTVRQPLRAMGRQAVESLLVQLATRAENRVDESQATIIFPTEIITRASVADRPPGM